MGRRSDHTRDELKTLALDAAETIVREHGSEALTARRIAQHIGYSPGTLYNVFADVDDIILHVNARTLGRLAAVCGKIKGPHQPEDWLVAYAKIYLRFAQQNRQLWSLVMASARIQPKPDWYTVRVENLLALISDALEPLFADGDTGAPQRSAQVLWAALHGIMVTTENAAVDAAPAELVEDLVARYVTGLRAAIPSCK